jgi:carboxymethylenebutenolidase
MNRPWLLSIYDLLFTIYDFIIPRQGSKTIMKTETLNLKTQRGATTAFVAAPAERDARTGAAAVLLIQEWWGINDHIRDLAGRYAKEGFLCVAPDLYRGKTAQDQEEASRLMHELEIDDGMDTIRQAIEETRRAYGVERIGITGYCMGGTFALRAACEINTLVAAAPFYGDIPEEQTLRRLKVPTLFIAGSRDNWITPEKVEGLKESARKYDLPVEVVSYDADHAFFNDTRPEVYNAEAAADAWRRVLAFFRERLQK